MTQDEIIGALRKPFFAPRPQPTPIPNAAWNDSPLFCLKVNDEWASHILGVMEALDQQDTWIGSSAEILDARQQVLQIMKALMTMCEDCAIEFQIVDCELQYRNSPEDEWTSLGNVCGADGAPGAPGADGDDCDCAEFNHVPTPTNPEGADDDQTACNISAGISEYLRDKEIFSLGQAMTAVGITTAIMGVVASIIAAVVTGGLAAPAIIAAVTVFINVLLAADGTERDAQIADDSFWNSLSCCIYCALKPNKDFDETLQIAIGAAIRACDYTSGSYDAPFWYDVLASLFEALPIEVIRNNVAVGALINYDCSGCECAEIGVFIWDEIAATPTQIFPDEFGLYSADSGTVLSGGRYVCSVFFQDALPVPESWNCANLTVVSDPTGEAPVKYKCSDYTLGEASDCVAQRTFFSTTSPFTVTFNIDVC